MSRDILNQHPQEMANARPPGANQTQNDRLDRFLLVQYLALCPLGVWLHFGQEITVTVPEGAVPGEDLEIPVPKAVIQRDLAQSSGTDLTEFLHLGLGPTGRNKLW